MGGDNRVLGTGHSQKGQKTTGDQLVSANIFPSETGKQNIYFTQTTNWANVIFS